MEDDDDTFKTAESITCEVKSIANKDDNLESFASKVELKLRRNDDSLEVLESLTDKTKQSFQEMDTHGEILRIKLYRRRWLILLLFTLFVVGNQAQSMQYTVILNILLKYYKVSTLVIESTAIIYNVLFFISLFPIMRMINKHGLRLTFIVATALTCLGTWIKYFSTSREYFLITMLGQCFIAVFNSICTIIPATLATYWFDPEEVATATGIGFSGLMFGIAISSVVTTKIVRMHSNLNDIGLDMQKLNLLLATYCTFIFLLAIIFFEEEPKLPPSKERAVQIMNKNSKFEFWSTVFRLIKNKNYFLLWNARGMIAGQIMAINAFFNALYLIHFEDGAQDVGKLCLLYTFCGFLGILIFGQIIDRTKKFKLIMVILSALYILCIILFALSLYMKIKWTVFASTGLLGCFGYSYYVLSFGSSAECRDPESGNFAAIILILGDQIYSAIILICSTQLIEAYDDLSAHIFYCIIAVVGFMITLLVQEKQKRQAVIKIENPIYVKKL